MHKRLLASIGIIAGLIAIAAILLTVARTDPTGWKAVSKTVMPQFLPSSTQGKQPLVYRSLSSDIDIGFVAEEEDRYYFIRKDQLKQWNVSEQRLYDTALDNLEKRSKGMSAEVTDTIPGDKRGTYVIVEFDDPYSAVRLLSQAVRDSVHKTLGEQYIAAIPTRDFLIFWHPSFHAHDAFVTQVKKEYNAEETYKLTAEPFLVTTKGIQPLTVLEKKQN